MTLLKKGNQYYYGNDIRKDYFDNLRSMGRPLQVVRLEEHNGRICEEMPVCRKPAAVMLVFRGEQVYLCQDAYERWKEIRNV